MTQGTPPPGDGPGPQDRVGTVAEEAAKLIALLGADPAAGTAPHTEGEQCREHRPPAGEAVACALCPVCQLIALLRTVRPETVDRLADLATAAATALREIATSAAAPTPTPTSSPGERGPGARRTAYGETASRAVPIEVVDEDEEHPQ